METPLPQEVKTEIITNYGELLKAETPTTPTTQSLPTMIIGEETRKLATGLESDLTTSKLFTAATKEQQDVVRKMIEVGNTGDANVKLEIAENYAKEWKSVDPTLQKMTTMVVDTKLANNVTAALNARDFDTATKNIALMSKDTSALQSIGKTLTNAPTSIIEKMKMNGVTDDVIEAIANERKQNAITELRNKGLGYAFDKFNKGETISEEDLNKLFENRGLVQSGMFKSMAENTATNKRIFEAKAEQLMFNGTAKEKTAFRQAIENEIATCKTMRVCT
jgi:hypothetical protein